MNPSVHYSGLQHESHYVLLNCSGYYIPAQHCKLSFHHHACQSGPDSLVLMLATLIFADSERLSDSQRRLSIIRETPDRANLERRSPAEGRVKGGGQALNSLSQKENAAGNLTALKQKLQNGILKAK